MKLQCGCCGDIFRPWNGYVDQDQDRGYGICHECQEDAEKREKELMDGIIAKVAESLNEKNQKKFNGFKRTTQENLIYKLMDEGKITWSIGGKHV